MSYEVLRFCVLVALAFSTFAHGGEPRRCLRDGKIIITDVTCELLGGATDLSPPPPEKSFQRGQPERKLSSQAKVQPPVTANPSAQLSPVAMQAGSQIFLNLFTALLIPVLLVTSLVVWLKRKTKKEAFRLLSFAVHHLDKYVEGSKRANGSGKGGFFGNQRQHIDPIWSGQINGTLSKQDADLSVQGDASLERNRIVDRDVAPLAAKPTGWSLELIREMEWKRFEDVCQQFFEKQGIRSETTALGPDGGIDIRLFQDGSLSPTSIAQCKAWGERYVGVKPIRELLGVMTHEKIGKAFFMTSGTYTSEAKAVADANRITLIDGPMLLTLIRRLPLADRKSLLVYATNGDYMTPSCPTCGTKMQAVEGTAGRHDFWGCQNYPRCRQTLGMRRARAGES